MNNLAKKWIEALRSGEYEQAKGTLQSITSGYCCLGVACIVAEQEGVQVERHDKGKGKLIGNALTNSLNNPVAQALQLTVEGEIRCVRWNDTDRLSFPEIADRIEREPDYFFKETPVERPSTQMD